MQSSNVSQINSSELNIHDTNQTDKAREQKLRWEAAVIGELKRKYVNCVNIERREESLNITNINLLVRFNKTREIFPSVTRVLSILLTTAATSASVERVNSKERVPKVPCSIPAASYAQRWALCSNKLANFWVSVKRVEMVERI